MRIKLQNCVSRWWILAIAWLGAHEGRTCPSPSRFSASFRLGAPFAVTWPLLHPELLLSADALLGNKGKGNHDIGASERLVFSLLFLQGMEKGVERKEAESHFHLKVSLTNPPGNGWGCYNHFVGLQSPALNLEGTILLGSSNTFCLSLLSI